MNGVVGDVPFDDGTGTYDGLKAHVDAVEDRRSGTEPYIVPLTSWRDKQELLHTWQRIARLVERSGGQVVGIADVSEVSASLQGILQELREQYALGYYPQPKPRRDGAWRQVEVSVGRPGARVGAREGYLDD